jgi:hypothetical protein
MDKLPYEQLVDMLAAAQTKITVGSHWQHFKGGEYVVKDLVLIEATNEPAVLYFAALHPEVLYVRPVMNWLETVTWNDQEMVRFVPLAAEATVPAALPALGSV